MINHDSRRTRGHGLLNKLMAVEILTAQGDEKIAWLQTAGIGTDATQHDVITAHFGMTQARSFVQ